MFGVFLCFFTPVCRAHHRVHVFTSERQRREETVWILLCSSDARRWQDAARWHPRAHYPQGNNCMGSLLRRRQNRSQDDCIHAAQMLMENGSHFAPNGLILPLRK